MFDTLKNRIQDWLSQSDHELELNGVNAQQWSWILRSWLEATITESAINKGHQVFVAPTQELAENLYAELSQTVPGYQVRFYPGLETSPYGGAVSSEVNLFKRFRVLEELHQSKERLFIITLFDALPLRVPPKDFFTHNALNIEISDVVSPYELAQKLTDLGYTSSTSVEEPGTFCRKGEVFDIFPLAHSPIRIHYFDDMIEEIFEIDPDTQRTIRDRTFQSLKIGVTPGALMKGELPQNLRTHLPIPGPRFKEKFENRKEIFQKISDGYLFENYPVYCPLFFTESLTLLDYLDDFSLFSIFQELEVQQNFASLMDLYQSEFEIDKEDIESDGILPDPSFLFDLKLYENLDQYKILKINDVNILQDIEVDKPKIDLHLENAKTWFNKHINPALPKVEYVKESLSFIKREFKHKGDLIFSVKTEAGKKEIEHLLDILEFPEELKRRVKFVKHRIGSGFYYGTGPVLVLSEGDLFANKQTKAKHVRQQDLDLFAEQLGTLKEGDFVIHNDHGIGKYIGMESLNHGGQEADFVVLEYTSQDKVYVPVYKLNLIQKHADSGATVHIDSLRTARFNKVKERARSGIKKLAIDLLRLQAERQTAKAFQFSEPDHDFKEFELSFPFDETPDQLAAIDDVLASMQRPTPMDHLVCGDVGFGKTEVAMRAAYKAVLDHKQVAVLVPTTVLALQHFYSFKERFKNFAVNIEFLSRFKSPKETTKIKSDLEKGEIDIVIGTHKLLSDKIKYADLGLVVVDEEQRFGVGHKEKLKVLKKSVDFLTMTATPIPRTLQLAFLGLRELSLIKTAPPKRQSIKTYLIKEDDRTIQAAIDKELIRGGQVFIVHNKVQDMENYVAYIRDLAPSAKIIFAHGQLPEKELETRMQKFYNNEYQILISTTIIESGIDIPNANTMIIDRADTFGLAQLHQLRGRIGRSDKKAYAYFVIPKHRSLTQIAEKRLKALQTYAEVGSGFNIATCDLEIRGAGDILGGEQSGHIEAIGLELYMELLKEAIAELKGEKRIGNRNIEISAPFPSYIPNDYIENSGERLKTYKKLSNCTDIESLKKMEEDLLDIYGAHPTPLKNLFALLESRNILQETGLSSCKVVGTSVIYQFDKGILDSDVQLRNKVVEIFLSQPKKYQFTPDYKVHYSHGSEVDGDTLISLAQNIAGQIQPC
ncbi:MAG: transcription-repair coupling factor [Deltaproteobacteria bacterium]|nr:MAG: transcription-repair coupling factor [Deltaproteobacteria bacterium]